MLTNLCKLDIFETRLKEMPPQICYLKNLQNLSEFVVGESSGIEELGKLPNLQGSLHISSLDKVQEVEDVSKANLKNKNSITYLRLEWNAATDVSHDKARDVLDRLQPHTNIEDLIIENYRGETFPDWIGLHSFSCIRKVILEACKNCGRLPPLGELPSLKYLHIDGFDMVEEIGVEFYLNTSSSSSSSSSPCATEPPFKSLETLIIDNMRERKEWSLMGGAFPNLKELNLRNCPKLKGACMAAIPSSEHLEIGNHQLVASLSERQYPSLNLLLISDCPRLKSFPQGRLPSTIQRIEIWGCNDLVSLSEEGWPCSNLKSLEINGCDKLFAHSNKWNLGMLTSLTSLKISGVDMRGLDSFPVEEGQLPTTLTSLALFHLRGLKSLNGTALLNLTSLQALLICYCHQLQCLPEEKLPASLSLLNIYQCSLLEPRCQRETGQDWDKIHHISNIRIDGEQI